MRFTIASDLKSRDVVAIGVGKKGKSFHPWTFRASMAAFQAGRNCGCGLCHNCLIKEQYDLQAEYIIGTLDEEWDNRWWEFGPTKDGLTL